MNLTREELIIIVDALNGMKDVLMQCKYNLMEAQAAFPKYEEINNLIVKVNSQIRTGHG